MTATRDVEKLLDAAYEIRVNNLPEAISLAERALQASLVQLDDAGTAKSYNMLGLFAMIRGEFQKSIDFTNEAIKILEKRKDEHGLAHAHYNLAGVYYKTNNYHLGLDYLLRCLSTFRDLKDFPNEARALKSIGTIYEYFGDNENAKASYEGSIEAARKCGDRNIESNAFNPLSGIYLKLGDIDRALSMAEESIQIKKETGDVRGLAFSIYARGKVALHTNDFAKAEVCFNESISLHKEMGDHLGEAMALNKLGRLRYEQNLCVEARSLLQQALDISLPLNIQVVVFNAYYNLYLVSKKEGNSDEALSLLEKYIESKNAVINTHTYNVIKSYQSIRKIELLEHEATIQKEKNEITEKKNGELDSFFYRVSHDLKGPISSLLGLNNLVTMEIKDATSLRYFEMYHTQIGRINKIVLDLIDLTRMNQEVRPVRIDFHSIIDECVHSYTYLENFKSIRFITDVDSEIEYHAEWGIVNTVLQNLIENSIKYSRKVIDAFVRVSVWQENTQLFLEVQDNGQGIHQDHQARIFDMFYRANASAKGTGLGLYILKRAVERLQGKINFESTEGKGTTFTIVLPIKRVHEKSHAPITSTVN